MADSIILYTYGRKLYRARLPETIVKDQDPRSAALILFHKILDDTGHTGIHRVDTLLEMDHAVLDAYGVSFEELPEALLDLHQSPLLTYTIK